MKAFVILPMISKVERDALFQLWLEIEQLELKSEYMARLLNKPYVNEVNSPLKYCLPLLNHF